MIKLKCLAGQLQDQILEFDTDCVVLGRGRECTLALEDDACSRYHARIVETSQGYTITDLESTNGLRLNGKPVKQGNLIEGDRFVVGRHVFLFLSPQPRSAGGEQVQDPLIENTVTLESVKKLGVLSSAADVEELRRVHVMMQAAYRLSQEISATIELDGLFTLITQSIFDNLRAAERVCLFLKRTEEAEIEMVRNVSRLRAVEFHVSRSLLKRVETQKVGILATDAARDDRFSSADSVVMSGLRSLMLVPLVARDRFLGAFYVENCSKPACFKTVDLELLTFLGTQSAYAIANALLYEDLQRSFYETIRTLSNTLEAKDHYTHGHSERVARYAVGIGLELSLNAARIDTLRIAAELHDIGKIALPETIISKPGKLTPEEYEAVKKHPQLGVAILQPIHFLKPAMPFILHHHEKFGGGGYPANIKGEQIPLEARIIGLADSFDAMTTQRPYNTPLTLEEALAQCESLAGTAFDPACVNALALFLEKEAQASADAEQDEAVDASANA